MQVVVVVVAVVVAGQGGPDFNSEGRTLIPKGGLFVNESSVLQAQFSCVHVHVSLSMPSVPKAHCMSLRY